MHVVRGRTATDIAEGLDAAIESVESHRDFRVWIDGERIRVEAPLVLTAWPDFVDELALEDALNEAAPVVRLYLAGGCDSEHKRCIATECTTRDVEVPWTPAWSGWWREQLVTLWRHP